MKSLRAKDLSPIEALTRDDEAWLQRLAESVQAGEHVVSLGDATEEPEPIVSRAYDGQWRAGRYVGSITFEDRQLEIEPRLAPESLQSLLRTALNVVIPMHSGRLERASMIVPLLLALVWCRELDSATRHGLPYLRKPLRHEGLFVRGRVDERRTRGLRRRGSFAVGSTSAERSLDNEIARTIVCGHRALARMLGSDLWMTSRANDVMPHLWSAVGPRPKLPSALSVRKIRYTPIRLPYRPLVEHSWEVARGRGLRGAGEGDAEGLLIDMAELWERYVFACTRLAADPGDEIVHQAVAGVDSRHLFRSVVAPDVGMGRLLPDVVVRRGGRVIAIVDAKYKLIANRAEALQGVTREDRYQLAGYLASYDPSSTTGMLAYPAELDRKGRELSHEDQSASTAELRSPWAGPGRSTATFSRVAFEPRAAALQIADFLGAANASP